jgi:ceramide glucosyltransferase
VPAGTNGATQFIIVERWLARGQPGGASFDTGRRSGEAQLASVGTGYHFLPSVLVGVRLRLAQPCFDSTIALRRETLAVIGGFDTCVDRLADDYAIRQSVRAEGTSVAIPSLVLAHSCAERSFALQLRPEFRRRRTLRVVYAPGYAGVIVTHPLAFAAIGAPPGDFEAPAIAMTAAAIGCQLVL